MKKSNHNKWAFVFLGLFCFFPSSAKAAQFLYDVSNHPQGKLIIGNHRYVLYVDPCKVDLKIIYDDKHPKS